MTTRLINESEYQRLRLIEAAAIEYADVHDADFLQMTNAEWDERMPVVYEALKKALGR